MARLSKQHRRRARRLLRSALFALLLLGAIPGLVIAGATGEAQLLWLIPAGMAAIVVGAPFAVLALLTASLPLLALGLAFGAPLFLAHRYLGAQGQQAPRLPADVTLRRRYVSGELSYAEFREQMLAGLKERYAQGELRLEEYEVEVERLLRPARELDAGRDPSLSGSLPSRGH
jgi:uncharacterized membrane protein